MTGRAIVPLIAVPDADDLGPAMAACNVGERAWVIAKIETGASNMECARLAGYSASSDEVLKSTGYMLAHRERVQSALLEMSRKLMRTEGPKSIKTLVEIRDNKASEAKDRIKASVELLNRAGMNAVSESHLTVTHELSPDQLDQKILALAAELGLSEDVARKMLIQPADLRKNADAIDAEFEIISPPFSPEERARLDRKNEFKRLRRAMTPEQRAAESARLRAERSARAKVKYAAAQSSSEGLEDVLEGIDFDEQ